MDVSHKIIKISSCAFPLVYHLFYKPVKLLALQIRFIYLFPLSLCPFQLTSGISLHFSWAVAITCAFLVCKIHNGHLTKQNQYHLNFLWYTDHEFVGNISGKLAFNKSKRHKKLHLQSCTVSWHVRQADSFHSSGSWEPNIKLYAISIVCSSLPLLFAKQSSVTNRRLCSTWLWRFSNLLFGEVLVSISALNTVYNTVFRLYRTNGILGTSDFVQNISKNIYSEIGKPNPQVRCYKDHPPKKQPFAWQI